MSRIGNNAARMRDLAHAQETGPAPFEDRGSCSKIFSLRR